MPHNTATDTSTGTPTGDEWGWLHTRPATPIHITDPTTVEPATEWAWIDPSRPHRNDSSPRRTHRRRAPAWIAGCTAAAVTGMVALGITTTGNTRSGTAGPTATAAPPTTTVPAAASACAGLTATVVTDGPGDTASVAGVIAAFEHAYYRDRSAETALRVVGPETGLAPDALAAGIASIPAGSTHCVAITPIAETTARVHVVELHPDRVRVDYLQLVNTRPAEGGGLLISNIQGQG
ncbi:hypothetical protein [Nocardia wallacei]|uniref:hypothetical protein n=1 Tax=Nocardia wallacei TaxID=480035 RepID=UPI002455FC92|nr:hypothetical protein [Nocardia wallacei]